jgi:hypothetical protein
MALLLMVGLAWVNNGLRPYAFLPTRSLFSLLQTHSGPSNSAELDFVASHDFETDKRLVYRDVLNTRRGAIVVHIDNPVHEKERITVRQKLKDVGGFHPRKLRSCAVRVRHRKPTLINGGGYLVVKSPNETSMPQAH